MLALGTKNEPPERHCAFYGAGPSRITRANRQNLSQHLPLQLVKTCARLPGSTPELGRHLSHPFAKQARGFQIAGQHLGR
jgi:hypothetical protein